MDPNITFKRPKKWSKDSTLLIDFNGNNKEKRIIFPHLSMFSIEFLKMLKIFNFQTQAQIKSTALYLHQVLEILKVISSLKDLRTM